MVPFLTPGKMMAFFFTLTTGTIYSGLVNRGFVLNYQISPEM